LDIGAQFRAKAGSGCRCGDDTAMGMMAGQGRGVAPRRKSSMQEFRHVLETRGRYQLVAVSHEPVYAPGDVVGHAVVADDGDRLTGLVSLAEARQLLLQRVREEGEEPGLENENHLRKKASRWRRR